METELLRKQGQMRLLHDLMLFSKSYANTQKKVLEYELISLLVNFLWSISQDQKELRKLTIEASVWSRVQTSTDPFLRLVTASMLFTKTAPKANKTTSLIEILN